MSQNAPQHGLIVQASAKRKPLREGQHRVLAATRVRITGVLQTTLGALDRDDARLLGHRGLTAWRVHWLLTKDEDWSKKHHRDLDEQLERFATRWARIDVQLVRYVQVDAPRLLAATGKGDIVPPGQPNEGNGDYTASPSRCIDRDAGAVVDPNPSYVKAARAWSVATRENFQTDLEAERAARKAERGRFGKMAA